MIKKILLFILVISTSFIMCGCQKDETFDPWDDLGGNQQGEVSSESDTTYELYDISSYLNQEVSLPLENYSIDLSNIDLSVVTIEDNNIVITKSGNYEFTGSYQGSIIIEDTDGKVNVILNNVTLNSVDTATIYFKKTSEDRILTVKDNTINTLTNELGTDEDSVIIAKKTSLVIQGTGTLNLIGSLEDCTGIKVKKELRITGTTINIDVNKNGIKADEFLFFENVNLKVNALNDGIKTDLEAESEEDGSNYTSSYTNGFIYIKNSNIDITATDDGIAANNLLYIDNTRDFIIDITTNSGAPSAITETSSDNASGKALKAGGVKLVIDDTEIDLQATYPENYGLVIKGGTFILNSNDDAITSKGNIFILDGKFDISTGDDGIHAEYLTKITGGEILINKCYEGVEGAQVEITGGDLNITSVDDAINAANGDFETSYNFYIYLDNANILINANGDGIDSNGNVTMNGGTVIIYGPTRGANASLDSDRGFVVNGGNLIAFGPMGMVENPASNSTQPYISLNTSTNSKNTVTIKKNNELLFQHTPSKTYQQLIVSLEDFNLNDTIILNIGSSEYEVTLSRIGNAIGQNSSGMGNQGQRPPRR